MPGQDHYWSQAAAIYEREFIDPYLPDVKDNLVRPTLKKLGRGKKKTVADLGCGIGVLLPYLSGHYHKVWAVDFADGMLERSRQACKTCDNVEFLRTTMLDLSMLKNQLDVAVAVNSLVMPNVADQDRSLVQIFEALKTGGSFLGIVPAMDAVHYYLMLLVDRALAAGKPIAAARKNALHRGELTDYDFTYGQFRFDHLDQHFWQSFEVHHRFRKAGFRLMQLKKVSLSWKQFACGDDLKQFDPPWDWFFLARKE